MLLVTGTDGWPAGFLIPVHWRARWFQRWDILLSGGRFVRSTRQHDREGPCPKMPVFGSILGQEYNRPESARWSHFQKLAHSPDFWGRVAFWGKAIVRGGGRLMVRLSVRVWWPGGAVEASA